MAILIISGESDESTSQVMQWLFFYNKQVHRINETCELDINSINITTGGQIKIKHLDTLINLEDISSFWYRKENFKIKYPQVKIVASFPFKEHILYNLKQEAKKINEFLHYKLLKKRGLGNFMNVDVNKLLVLDLAKDLGVKIPYTLITTEKEKLLKFKRKHDEIICKAISEAVLFSKSDTGAIFSYTKLLTMQTILEVKDHFAPTLFQAKVDKKYELRIFYLDGDFYTMAIFSQADKQTEIDFRNYNFDKPNRTVPYNLPLDIKNKLRLLMKELNLNTGSIDMAVNKNNDYVFFEVNPVGQYGMTSYPCNYYLDKKIAQYLIKQ